MSKTIKIIFLCFISLFICFLTYKLCYFIAEKYFFDKFFYRKSVTYGYWKTGMERSGFGNRSKDFVTLNSQNSNILGTKDDKNFNIAIIGDSYVWGTGIKNKNRFSLLLEKKLNKIRPTKIITIGEEGNGVLDHLRWYNTISEKYDIDLFVFALVSNDAFVDFPSYNYQDTDYQNIIKDCQTKNNNIKPINLNNTIDIYVAEDQGYSANQINSVVYNLQLDSWKNPTNLCIINKSLSLLPTTNSIYYLSDLYNKNDEPKYLQYISLLIENNKTILSSQLGKRISKYVKYFDNPFKYFTISPKESHPNALANQMYADILYNEITTNPRWGF